MFGYLCASQVSANRVFQFTMTSVLHGRLPARKMLLHWFLCFFGNLAGSLFVMAIIMGCKISPISATWELKLTESNRWRCFRCFSLQGRGDFFHNQEANNPAVASDLPARHRLQLARVSGRLPRNSGKGFELKGHRNVVAHLCIRVFGT